MVEGLDWQHALVIEDARNDCGERRFRAFGRIEGRLFAVVFTPRKANPKVFAAIRLDVEVVEAFKATGRGWQTRINDALKTWLKEHPENRAG